MKPGGAAALVVLVWASSARAEPWAPVWTAGAGFGGVEEIRVCPADGPCRTAAADGPAIWMAGGFQYAGRLGGLRAQLQLAIIAGSGSWALSGGPMVTVSTAAARVLMLEFGVGLALFHAEDQDASLTGAGGTLRGGLAARVAARWTIHAGLDLMFGSGDIGGLLGVSVTRQF